jgi:mannose-6-phosphate isomerase-like protein (cupin superfamily)
MAQSGSDDAVEIFEDLSGESAGVSYGVITFGVKPHSSTEPHRHTSEETWIVRSGSGSAALGAERVGLHAGARLTVPADLLHHIQNDGPEPLIVLSFWWKPTRAL